MTLNLYRLKKSLRPYAYPKWQDYTTAFLDIHPRPRPEDMRPSVGILTLLR